MTWFYDLKITTKLIGSFLLVACISGIVGVFGILSLQRVGDSDAILYEKNAAPLGQLVTLSTAYQRMRVNLFGWKDAFETTESEPEPELELGLERELELVLERGLEWGRMPDLVSEFERELE